MKVYTKKEDYRTTVPVYVLMLVWLAIPLGIFIYAYSSDLPTMQVLTTWAIPFTFTLMFLGLDILFMYFLIKKPVPYKAKLVKKEKQKYNNQDIIYMGFEVMYEETETKDENDEELDDEKEENVDLLYYCYTTEDNSYKINGEYNLYLKEFNWRPKYIEEPKGDGNVIKDPTLLPLLIVMGSIFALIIIFSIIGLIKYRQFKIIYSLAILIFSIGLYTLYKFYKDNK